MGDAASTVPRKKLTPEEVLLDIQNIQKSILSKPVVLRRTWRKAAEAATVAKKDASSSEEDEPPKSSKRRRVKAVEEDDSPDDLFEKSPLRKSLSPISPKSSDKKRYKTRHSQKKISYEDLPEMSESDTDFDSPKGDSMSSSSSSGLEDSDCSVPSPVKPPTRSSRTTRARANKRLNGGPSPKKLRSRASRSKNPAPAESASSSEEEDPSPRKKPAKEVVESDSSEDQAESQKAAAVEWVSTEEEDVDQAKEEKEKTEEVEWVSTEEDQAHEEEDSPDLEEMIVTKRGKRRRRFLQVAPEDQRAQNKFNRFDTAYYRDPIDALAGNESDLDMIASESEESSGEPAVETPSKKQVLSDSEDDSEDDQTASDAGDEECDEVSAEEDIKGEPTRRVSGRKRESKDAAKRAKYLKTIREERTTGKRVRRSQSWGRGEEDTDEADKENISDFFAYVSQYQKPSQRKTKRIVLPPSQEDDESDPPETGDPPDPVQNIHNSQEPGSSRAATSPAPKDTAYDADVPDFVDTPESVEDPPAELEEFSSLDCSLVIDEDEVVEILKSGNFKEFPDTISPDSHPALLCEACASSSADLVEYLLLKFGYDPLGTRSTTSLHNKPGSKGRPTPLTQAVLHNKPETLKKLLDATRDSPSKVIRQLIRCADGLVADDISCIKAIGEWCELHIDPDTRTLIEEILEDTKGSKKMLGTIGEKMNLTALKFLIAQEINLSEYEYESSSLLILNCMHNASLWKEQEEKCKEFLSAVLKALKNKDGIVNGRGDENITPLMRASQLGVAPVVQLLINNGAKVRLKDDHNSTALQMAAAAGHDRCVEIILRSDNTALNDTDECSWSPIMYAAFHENWETVDLMLGSTFASSSFIHSRTLLGAVHEMIHRNYRRKEKKMARDNYDMVMKLIRHMAEADQYRDQLNLFVEHCSGFRTVDEDICLALLRMPGLISSAVKMKFLRVQLNNHEHRNAYSSVNVTVSRETYLSDLASRLPLPDRNRITAKFRKEPATGPGPTKEFFSMFGQEVLKEKLFEKNSKGLLNFTYLVRLYSKPKDLQKRKKFLKYYELCGEMAGRALVSNYLIGLPLSDHILNYMLGGKRNVLKEMETLDKEMYNAINSVPAEEFQSLEIPFYLDLKDPFTGKNVESPLKEKIGKDETAASKQGYLTLLSRKKLYDFCQEELIALKRGFNKIFPAKFKDILTPRELGGMIAGVSEIDVSDWIQNSDCRLPQETKTMFWRCVQSFKPEDRLALLHFTTGMSALPPGGFACLPGNRFTVVSGYGNLDEALPMAATCFNQLSLPPYSTESSMRTKLLIAVRYGAKGFVFM